VAGAGFEREAEDEKINREISCLFGMLDDKSRALVWHMLLYGHASIRELREKTRFTNDMEVLARLKEVINPAAEDLTGGPLVEFVPFRVHPATGECITFHWWLKDLLPPPEKWVVDVFPEEDGMRVMILLPAGLNPVRVAETSVANNVLTLKLVY